MLIFTICSVFGEGTVAISDGEHTEEKVYPQGQGRLALPCLEELLGKWGRKRTDITHVGVCVGPGSFTGIRVGLGIAVSVARALGVQVQGKTVFDIIKENAGRTETCRIFLDAGQNRLYTCDTEKGNPESIFLSDIPAPGGGSIILGNGASKHKEAFLEKGWKEEAFLQEEALARAGVLAEILKRDIEKGNDQEWENPKALYLRKSAPEEKEIKS